MSRDFARIINTNGREAGSFYAGRYGLLLCATGLRNINNGALKSNISGRLRVLGAVDCNNSTINV